MCTVRIKHRTEGLWNDHCLWNGHLGPYSELNFLTKCSHELKFGPTSGFETNSLPNFRLCNLENTSKWFWGESRVLSLESWELKNAERGSWEQPGGRENGVSGLHIPVGLPHFSGIKCLLGTYKQFESFIPTSCFRNPDFVWFHLNHNSWFLGNLLSDIQ